MAFETIKVKRDVDAVLIPLGTPVTIPKGSEVRITQDLGDSYTISVNMNLARVEGKDADALGIGDHGAPHAHVDQTVDGRANIDEIWEALKNCYDPEIPVNIVDLGLIYDCQLVDVGEVGSKVIIVMTLTAPGCGMGPFIVEDVRSKAADVKNVTDVHIELVFDPPWDRTRMSDEARLQLGMF